MTRICHGWYTKQKTQKHLNSSFICFKRIYNTTTLRSSIKHFASQIASRGIKISSSCFLAKLIMKLETQLKAHFSGLSNLSSTNGFLSRFWLACDTIIIYKKAVMWVLLQHVKETLENALYSRTCAGDRLQLLFASVGEDETRVQPLSQAFLEVIYYFSKMLSSNQAVAVYSATNRRIIQPTNMIPRQRFDDFIARSCKVTDVYDNVDFYHVVL